MIVYYNTVVTSTRAALTQYIMNYDELYFQCEISSIDFSRIVPFFCRIYKSIGGNHNCMILKYTSRYIDI